MHGWETRMLLKYYLERGVSKAELSRRFGVSRRTIHAWVESGQLDRDLGSGGSVYSPRPAVVHKLDPYTGIIDTRLEEFPGLSAKRLFDEVRAAGYPGGYTRVRDYVRAVRPCEPREPVVRFETPVGLPGPGGLCDVQPPLGSPACLGGGAELLAAAVAGFLLPADDGRADRRARERFCAVRWSAPLEVDTFGWKD